MKKLILLILLLILLAALVRAAARTGELPGRQHPVIREASTAIL